MSKARLKDMFFLGIKEMRDPYYQGFSAQLAFYFMLSIVPLVLLLSQVLGFFSISLDFIYEYLGAYLKGDAAELLIDMLKSGSSGSLNAALIIIALWAASKAQYALNRIANYMSNDAYGKGYFRERFRAIVNILVTVATITAALTVLVYGKPILKIVLATVLKNSAAQQVVSRAMLAMRWPVMLILYFLMISFNYYVLPTKRVRYREVLPGSIFAALAMLVGTSCFSFYTMHIAGYNLIYGSLASLVMLMLWFIMLAWVLGLGLLFNKLLKDTRGKKYD